MVAVLFACVGLPTDGTAQGPGEAVADADDVVGTDARDAVDSPTVTGKTYGGKASAAYVVRKRTAIRRQAAKAVPTTGDALQDWINGPSGLADWAGRRRPLENRGVTISGFSATTVLGNATGGARRSWTAANSTLIALDADFDKLAGWPGLLIRAEGRWAGGNNLSAAGRVGNLFSAASTYTPNGLYLAQLYAEQHLFDEQLVLQIGRLASANNFASLPIAADYVSAAINAVPLSLPINTLPFTDLPATQWGAVATVAPLAEIELTAGMYNAERRSSELSGTHGVDFGLNLERGVMAIGQAAYLREQARGDRGLPGIYTFIQANLTEATTPTISPSGAGTGSVAGASAFTPTIQVLSNTTGLTDSINDSPEDICVTRGEVQPRPFARSSKKGSDQQYTFSSATIHLRKA